MLNTFSTHRIFGFLLTVLMLTSCSGGTSSNTGTGTPQAQNNSDGGNTTQPQNNSGGGNTTQPQTLTVTIPSLGRSYTITKGRTTQDDIDNIVFLEQSNCDVVFGSVFPDPPPPSNRTCKSQVNSAAQQARNFINS